MITNSIALGRLDHIRNSPSSRGFGFKHTMILLNLSNHIRKSHLPWPLKNSKYGLISIFNGNHIDFQNKPLIEKIIANTKGSKIRISKSDTIFVLSAPSVIGYSFNPASFYFVFDDKEIFKGSIVEVHNTFKESHLYELSSVFNSSTRFEDSNIKQFHVSPFLDRKGYYKFEFSITPEKFDIRIGLFEDDNLVFSSNYRGVFIKLTTVNLLKTLPKLLSTVGLTEIRILTQAAIIFFIHKMPFFEKPNRLKGTSDSPAIGFISKLKIPFK
jgi:DUF1365 family protein